MWFKAGAIKSKVQGSRIQGFRFVNFRVSRVLQLQGLLIRLLADGS